MDGIHDRYKVFMRVVGTVSMDVEADSPEEAAEKASDELESAGDRFGMKFLQMDVDDLESYFPVAYNDPDSGDTKDIIVPDELREKEAGNALAGMELWALSELVTDGNGIVGDPKVSLFLGRRRAYEEMLSRYSKHKEAMEADDRLDMFLPPCEGEDGCYISEKGGPCVTWSMSVAKLM